MWSSFRTTIEVGFGPDKAASVISRPRVCYFRGSFLNPFECQYLELLEAQFDLTVAHSKSHRYYVSAIPLGRAELGFF
jgi:hypothetical protein